MEYRAHLAPQGSLGEGAGLGAMGHEECLARPAQRVTVALMDWLACRERRATGVTLAPLARQVLQETMETGVMMEKSDPEGFLGSRDHVVFWDPRGPPALLDLLV